MRREPVPAVEEAEGRGRPERRSVGQRPRAGRRGSVPVHPVRPVQGEIDREDTEQELGRGYRRAEDKGVQRAAGDLGRRGGGGGTAGHQDSHTKGFAEATTEKAEGSQTNAQEYSEAGKGARDEEEERPVQRGQRDIRP